MKTIAIIQARMNSTRLPGKVLLLLAGKPLLWHVYNRLSFCKEINKIIIATSRTKNDDKIANFCKKNKIDCYRGSLNNVFKRFIDVLNKYHADYVVRVCADAPLIVPEFIDAHIKALKLHHGDNIIFDGYCSYFLGQSVYSVKSFRKAYFSSKDKRDLEHAGSFYFAKHLKSFKMVRLNVPKELTIKNCKLVVDTPEDYRLVSKIYKDLYRKNKIISVYAVKKWINKNKKLFKIDKNELMKPYFSKLKKIERDNSKKANIVGTYVLRKKDFIK